MNAMFEMAVPAAEILGFVALIISGIWLARSRVQTDAAGLAATTYP